MSEEYIRYSIVVPLFNEEFVIRTPMTICRYLPEVLILDVDN